VQHERWVTVNTGLEVGRPSGQVSDIFKRDEVYFKVQFNSSLEYGGGRTVRCGAE
jgi:hypothetical protein